jgi:hypothetical protein
LDGRLDLIFRTNAELSADSFEKLTTEEQEILYITVTYLPSEDTLLA